MAVGVKFGTAIDADGDWDMETSVGVMSIVGSAMGAAVGAAARSP